MLSGEQLPVAIPMIEVCELVGLLNHAQQCITREIEDVLKEHGLSLAKYNILNELAAAGGRLPFSTLVERLGCVRSNVTGLIDRLQEDQLVQRCDHPEDRRMLFAELTNEGRALLATATPAYNVAITHAFGILDETQRDTLGKLLNSLLVPM
jgi:MarR family 2-MHQ and catechol resistance regulon transcriptional repressor